MREALLGTYAPPEVVFSHGQGSYLYTEKDDRYLDFYTGIAVNAFGHAHPYLVKALTAQAQKLWHTANTFRIPAGERLAQRLVDASFADKVFFTNSGAEAVECGLKMMRRYFFDKGETQRTRIIGMQRAFHGRTIATISAAGNPSYTKGFLSGDMGFDHVEFGDLDALSNVISEQTAGIILEPVQGEGGIFAGSEEYLSGVSQLCQQHGILLLLDEVQCGNGRTGKLFAHEWYDCKPDIIATAKGLGGGFPLGACLANNKVAESMVVGTHGSTFGGNPLAMAVGNAVLDLLLEDGFLQSVESRSEQLMTKLRALIEKYPHIINQVRGKGLMIGLQCVVENAELLNALKEKGLLVVKAGENTIRLLPPLNVSSDEVDEAISILETVCQNWPTA